MRIGRNKFLEIVFLLQPFFVLHKATSQKPASKTRRRIDLSPQTSDGSTDEYNHNSRFETFRLLWSNTESIVKVFFAKQLNQPVFFLYRSHSYAKLPTVNLRTYWKISTLKCLMKLISGSMRPSTQFVPAELSSSPPPPVCTRFLTMHLLVLVVHLHKSSLHCFLQVSLAP